MTENPEIFKNASWIWAKECGGVNEYVRFRDEAVGGAGKWTLRVSVDTNYALTINGTLAAFGQYADYPFDKVYDELDVTEFMTEGNNELVFDCWHQGNDSSTVRGEQAGLIYVLTCGDRIVLVSSPAASAALIPQYDMGSGVELVSGQLGYSFHYDSRRPDDAFASAEIVEKPLPARVRPIRKLLLGENELAYLTVNGTFRENRGGTVGQRMQYAAMMFQNPNYRRPLPSAEGIRLKAEFEGDGVFAVIDTERENAGILSLDVELPEDAEILVGWGEHLDDLRVRAYVGTRNFCASYYGKKGRNRFLHPFRRLGMRYLQIHIYAKEALIHYAGIRTTDYPLSCERTFTCADSLHTKIYDVCKRTLLMSMHEHYEDCPWREQALYTMDSRNQMLCGYYAFGETEFPKASIRLMAESIREDRMLELCSPARVSITIPSFSAIFLTQVYEYLKYSGDRAFVSEMLPTMRQIADEFIARMQNELGLIRCFTETQYWNFYEWQDGLSGSIGGSVAEEDVTYDAPLCGFASFGLRSLADTLDELGDTESAAYYRNQHETLNQNIDRYFWNEEKGAYGSYLNRKGELVHYAELTNSLIVYADAAQGEHLDRTLVNLAGKTLLPVTLSHSIFKYEALLRQKEKYLRTVFDDIADKWGYMLYHEATTFWETIEGSKDFGNAGSLCHGWSAIPIYFYHEYALKESGADTGLYEAKVTETIR